LILVVCHVLKPKNLMEILYQIQSSIWKIMFQSTIWSLIVMK